MNQKHLETLNSIISKRPATAPDSEIDQAILQAAKQHAAQRRNSVFSTSVNFVGHAGAALIVTTVFFTALAKIILPAPSNIAHGLDGITNSNKLSAATQAYSPDQVLLELSLPSVTDIIRSTEFMREDQRSAATMELISALADINNLLDQGELDLARTRYLELRERCYVCQLPNSLEAFALSRYKPPKSS